MDQEDSDGDGIGDVCEEMSTVISLSSFTASPSSRAVILAWATESEIDNAGFNLYRAEVRGRRIHKDQCRVDSGEGLNCTGRSV